MKRDLTDCFKSKKNLVKIKELGKGGFAVVYLVEDKDDETDRL